MRTSNLSQREPRIKPATVALCGLTIFRPGLAGYDLGLQITFGLAGVVVFLCLLLSNFKNHVRLPWYFTASAVYCVAKLPQTIALNEDGLLAWGTDTVALLSLGLLFAGYASRSLRNIISGLYYLFAGYVAVNLISVILYSTGEFRESTVFFLGIRVNFTVVLLTYATLSLLYSIQESRRSWIHPLVAFSMSFVTAYLTGLSTAWVALTTLIGTYFILLGPAKLKNPMPLAVIIGASINVLIVFFRVQESFEVFLRETLDRDANLTGRTDIWDVAIQTIYERPFFGHGQSANGGSFVELWDQVWPAHNSFLQILHEGGIVLILIFLYILARSVKGSPASRSEERDFRVLAAALLAFLVAGVAGGSANSVQFFALLYLANEKKRVST